MPTDWKAWIEKVARMPRFEGDYTAGDGPGVWSVYVTERDADGSATSDAAEQIATVIDKDTAEYLAECASLIPLIAAAIHRGEIVIPADKASHVEGEGE